MGRGDIGERNHRRDPSGDKCREPGGTGLTLGGSPPGSGLQSGRQVPFLGLPLRWPLSSPSLSPTTLSHSFTPSSTESLTAVSPLSEGTLGIREGSSHSESGQQGIPAFGLLLAAKVGCRVGELGGPATSRE